MKSTRHIFPSLLLLAGLQFGVGCVSDAYVSTGVYYGPHYRRPWFHDDPWMDGHHHYYERDHYRRGGDVYISPPRLPAPPRPPGLRLP